MSSRKRHMTKGIKIKMKLASFVEGNPTASLSKATTPNCRGEHYTIPWIAPLYP